MAPDFSHKGHFLGCFHGFHEDSYMGQVDQAARWCVGHGNKLHSGQNLTIPPSLQLIPFLPSDIPYALETLCAGGLFSDGGHSFLQNL